MLLSLPQIKAARALLGWNQEDLATHAGVKPDQIRGYEAGRTKPADVGEAIFKAFTAAGLIFPNGGVQPASTIYTLEGRGWYLDLLNDILLSGAKEVTIQNVDNRKSSSQVIDMMRSMRKEGVTFRMTTEEGNDYLLFPVSCYRWIPKKYFKNWIVVTFGDFVAFSIHNETGCRVVRDTNLADTLRNQFNLVWDILQPLDVESTAHERIE